MKKTTKKSGFGGNRKVPKILKWFKKNWLLILIIILGGFFRFYNLGWDQGHFFNPDERDNIIFPAVGLKFPFKPSQFTYGSLTIYLYRLGGELMAWLTNNQVWLDAAHISLVGRFFSALISLGAIGLTYWLGKKIFSKTNGLIAASLVSLNVGLIQASHFGTTETILTLSGLSISLASVLLFTKKYRLGWIIAGLSLGLGTTAKLSALIFLPPLLLSHLLSFRKKSLFKKNAWALLGGLLAFLIFFLVSPYAFFDSRSFIDSFLFQKKVATGEISTFYTAQFKETFPYFFQTFHVFPWIFGWPVLGLGVLGAILLFFQSLKEKNGKKFSLFFLPVFYFLYNGSLFVKWTRYWIPLCPFFCLFATVFATQIYQMVKKKSLTKIFISLLIAGVLGFQFFYALAFFHIYQQPDSRIIASEWIYQNIPPQNTLLLEPLDVVALPLTVENLQPSLYHQIWFDFYGLDDGPEKKKAEMIKELSNKLTKADWIIIGSRRIWANRLRLQNQFPLGAKYYSLLFSGKLGFEEIKEISSYPKIFGFEFYDDQAEETFQVFDHPTIKIYQKIKRFSARDYEKILKI